MMAAQVGWGLAVHEIESVYCVCVYGKRRCGFLRRASKHTPAPNCAWESRRAAYLR